MGIYAFLILKLVHRTPISLGPMVDIYIYTYIHIYIYTYIHTYIYIYIYTYKYIMDFNGLKNQIKTGGGTTLDVAWNIKTACQEV